MGGLGCRCVCLLGERRNRSRARHKERRAPSFGEMTGKIDLDIARLPLGKETRQKSKPGAGLLRGLAAHHAVDKCGYNPPRRVCGCNLEGSGPVLRVCKCMRCVQAWLCVICMCVNRREAISLGALARVVSRICMNVGISQSLIGDPLYRTIDKRAGNWCANRKPRRIAIMVDSCQIYSSYIFLVMGALQ